jgi:hypothetical protein
MPILEAAHDEFMIGVGHIIDTMMDEIDKKLKAEKRINRRNRQWS